MAALSAADGAPSKAVVRSHLIWWRYLRILFLPELISLTLQHSEEDQYLFDVQSVILFLRMHILAGHGIVDSITMDERRTTSQWLYNLSQEIVPTRISVDDRHVPFLKALESAARFQTGVDIQTL